MTLEINIYEIIENMSEEEFSEMALYFMKDAVDKIVSGESLKWKLALMVMINTEVNREGACYAEKLISEVEGLLDDLKKMRK